MNPAGATLLQALRQPESLARLPPDAADLVSRQATSAGLLGRLAQATESAGIDDQLPLAVGVPESTPVTSSKLIPGGRSPSLTAVKGRAPSMTTVRAA